MTILQKINNLTWWNEPNKLKDILKSLLTYLDILDTKVSALQNNATPVLPVSATQSGIVNNVALQELGGVDKTINGVRIGRGGNNNIKNLIFGDFALLKNTDGINNLALGASALRNNTTGGGNLALGFLSLFNNTTGSTNLAIGGAALINNTTGSNNIVINTNVLNGDGITTGSGNVIIGNAANNASNLTNNIIFADGAGNKRFSINATGVVKIVTSPLVFTDNTTAIAGGLTAGDIYRTSLGVMMIVF